jgi:hypothetical protein
MEQYKDFDINYQSFDALLSKDNDDDEKYVKI